MKTIGTLVYDPAIERVGEIVRFDPQFVSALVAYDEQTRLWRPPDALETLCAPHLRGSDDGGRE